VVRELPAGLGVERSAVERDLDVRARPSRLRTYAVHEQTTERRPALDLGVTGERGRAAAFQQRAVDAQVGVAGLALGGVARRAEPLLLHQPAELALVDRQALLPRHLDRE